MSSKYTIIIENEYSGKDFQQYMLFNEPPTKGSLGTVFSNVWAKTPGIKGGAEGNFTFNNGYYAVCGTTSDGDKLDNGMTITTTDTKPVVLGHTGRKGDIVTVQMKLGGLGFDDTVTLGAPDGEFTIKGAVFNPAQYKGFWYGVARLTNGKVRPVLTWPAETGKSSDIAPVMQFWISTGSFTDGTTVKKTDFGQTGTIDFTGKQETVATLTQKADGTYSPAKYSFPTSNGSDEGNSGKTAAQTSVQQISLGVVT